MFDLRIKLGGVLALSLLLTGCSIGPKYVKPSVGVPVSYKESADWKIAEPQDDIIRGQWWKIYRDPRLNELMAQLNISNQNIALAQAQYAQSYAIVQASKSSFFPTLGADASYTRSRNTSSQQISRNLLNADVSWELDLWGRVRKTIEADRANAEVAQADLEGVRLSAQAQLAKDYFQLSSLDAQKKLFTDTKIIYEKFFNLTKNRYDSGIASEADLLQARTQLESIQAQEIGIGVQRAQLEHAIAVALGKTPAEFSLAELAMPQEVPIVPAGLPSALLERRPDIAAAERSVAAANALIGVAQSAYFPTITVGASGSYQSSSLSNLFSSPNPLWSVGPALAETIFDGGLRRAQNMQTKAAYDAAVASYRQTVLTAFQQVEDNLAALRILEQQASIQDKAVKDAQKAVELQTNQYKAGTVSALDVINTQAIALSNQRTAVGIQAERLNASVLLIQYLGGEWSVGE